MNDETAKLIQDLAAKLGTTADHLWGVLVRQAPVSSMISILSFVLQGCAVYFYAKWLMGRPAIEDDDAIPQWIGRGAMWCVLIVVVICLLCDMDDMATNISGFTNPEYWALKQIVK